ncbi:hypothetical protein LCGC14_0313570 [marine sediment metagenome]|uniref:Peptidase S74 domain-containing protein n=1 Tax=marine sediment metagenome TaxID=412755 RepID=A0A0F9TLR4_9ZZZZ
MIDFVDPVVYAANDVPVTSGGVRPDDFNTNVINAIKALYDLMVGAAEFVDAADATGPLFIPGAGLDFTIRLPDNAGARKVIIQDSDSATVATIDSNGLLSLDVIGELGADAGVTVDGLLIKNGEANLSILNGGIVETIDASASSDGATITFSVQKEGGGNLTLLFSDGFTTFTAAPATIALTAGSATSPQQNYVYILQSTKALTVSTSAFPSAEHAPLATVIVQTAALVQTNGALKFHAWTDHLSDADNQGQLSHFTEWIREQHATWKSGVSQTLTITGGSPDTIDFATTSGTIFQLHPHTMPAKNTGTGSVVHVVNDNASPYTTITDLADLLTDNTGASMSGKYFNLVIWASISEAAADSQLFVNLPGGSYNKQTDAEQDVLGYTVFDLPADFKGAAFLISRLLLKHSAGGGGTWTSVEEADLRGKFPSSIAGTTTQAIATTFADNAFKIFDEGDATRILDFQLSGITTGNTRTITMPDEDVTLIDDATSDPLIDADSAADGTEGSLARKDHVHPKHHAKYTDAEAVLAVEAESTLEFDAATTISTAAGNLTLDPAGSLIIPANQHIQLGNGSFANVATDNSSFILSGGTDGAAGKASRIIWYGATHATEPGALHVLTSRADAQAYVKRLDISGVVATAVATWASITHEGFVASADIVAQTGIRIGADSGDNEIDDATQGAASTQLFIGNASINVTSDARLKVDIEDTQRDALSLIRQMRVVDFAWDDPADQSPYGRNYRGRYTGMLAHETIKVAPWIVNDQGGGRDCPYCSTGLPGCNHLPWKVEYEHLAGLQIKGIQQLIGRIEELEAEVAALQAA